jgi:hypothetical protein
MAQGCLAESPRRRRSSLMSFFNSIIRNSRSTATRLKRVSSSACDRRSSWLRRSASSARARSVTSSFDVSSSSLMLCNSSLADWTSPFDACNSSFAASCCSWTAASTHCAPSSVRRSSLCHRRLERRARRPRNCNLQVVIDDHGRWRELIERDPASRRFWFRVHRLEESREAANRFRRPEVQEAAGFEGVMEDGKYPLLKARFEIDQQIAAADEIHARKRRIADDILPGSVGLPQRVWFGMRRCKSRNEQYKSEEEVSSAVESA